MRELKASYQNNLCDIDDIAEYLALPSSKVMQQFLCKPSFPKPKMSGRNGSSWEDSSLWAINEVTQWVKQHQETDKLTAPSNQTTRKPKSIESLWRVKDIAEYLSLSVSTIYANIICKPDFPQAVRLGKSPRWFPNEVKIWVRRQRDSQHKSRR